MPVGTTAHPWLAALFAPALSARQRWTLIDQAGPGADWNTRARYAAGSSSASEVGGALARGAADPRVALTLNWLAADDHHLVTVDDVDYPRLLREIADPPLALYLRGRRDLLGCPMLAVVGSRNPSAPGVQTAEAFARSLAQAGLTIVSGLALGIDAAAHRGALTAPASTIAVVGTGLDIVYPVRNGPLAQQIAACGALLSEFPLGTPPCPDHFPRRNRILSGLSLGCVVVEANLRSGSLITARLAAEQGREVFAIPGSIHSPLAKGCHALIKQGAKLTESAADVLEELRWVGRAPATEPTAGPDDASACAPEALVGETPQLLAALSFDPISVDTLVALLRWPAQRVASGLLELELVGRVARVGHGTYQRLPGAGDVAAR
ncbi:MAG: DNA-protecting protein DprA [Proteobacteria bacterium]|nr:DNA-protecting protein DprA [Burkholderiales bacterium]